MKCYDHCEVTGTTISRLRWRGNDLFDLAIRWAQVKHIPIMARESQHGGFMFPIQGC